MKLHVALAIALLTSSISAFAQNGAEGGGGGGGVCAKGKCMTLAELGVRVDSISSTYRIEPDVLVELVSIAKQIPVYGKEVYQAAIDQGSPESPLLIRVDKISSSSMRKIKSQYGNVLKRSGMSDQRENLSIFAASLCENVDHCRKVKTFLLPAFFQLSPRQQALILIHESVVRKTLNFLDALEVDRAILDLADPATSPVRPIAVLRRHFERGAGVYSSEDEYQARDEVALMQHALKLFEQRTGRTLELEDFVDPSDYSSIGDVQDSVFKSMIEMSPERFLATTKTFPEFKDIFGMAQGQLAYHYAKSVGVGSDPKIDRALAKACSTASRPDSYVAIPVYANVPIGEWKSNVATAHFGTSVAFVKCGPESDRPRPAVVSRFNNLFRVPK